MDPAWTWTVHPEAALLAGRVIADAVGASPPLTALAETLGPATSTRLFDWVDHVETPLVGGAELRAVGYEPTGIDDLWRHPGAQLPAIVPASPPRVAVRVDDVERAAQVHGGRPVGREGGRLRMVEADGLVAVERRSWAAGRTPDEATPVNTASRRTARERWAARPRHDDADLDAAIALAHATADDLGADLCGSYLMEAERAYWQSRNAAARAQHARQDRLGLGWGNHDHHTFRSSRAPFPRLVALLEAAGFTCRERFHAGADAGWGAQVLEHHGAGLVVFADVDLLPGESDGDFAHEGLAVGVPLGAVGTWCALHGESILDAGMHHLEAQFAFDEMRDAMAAIGIAHNPPFSDLPHLRQAFTAAETWPVDPERLDRLVADGTLAPEVADRYRSDGAPGSHLETLARADGFKGFNQSSVSHTIRQTDLRTTAR